MLTIRRDQILALRKSLDRALQTRIVEHATKCFPEHYAALGARRITEAVAEGMRDARRAGLETDRELCEFVNLMFVFGPGFQDRPGFEWVRGEIAKVDDARPRAVRLRQRANQTIAKLLSKEAR